MQTVLRTTINVPPVQWARARTGGIDPATGRAKQSGFHTPAQQKRYKRIVADEGKLAMLTAKARRDHSGKPVPLGVPLIFEGLVFVPIPASFTRAQQADALDGVLRPTGKPDIDNWLKLPMDALEGVAYANDSQVVGFGRSGIWYSDAPRLEIHVYHAPPGQPGDWQMIDAALLNLRALSGSWRLAGGCGPDDPEMTGAELIDVVRAALGLGQLPLRNPNDE